MSKLLPVCPNLIPSRSSSWSFSSLTVRVGCFIARMMTSSFSSNGFRVNAFVIIRFSKYVPPFISTTEFSLQLNTACYIDFIGPTNGSTFTTFPLILSLLLLLLYFYHFKTYAFINLFIIYLFLVLLLYIIYY